MKRKHKTCMRMKHSRREKEIPFGVVKRWHEWKKAFRGIKRPQNSE